MNRLQAGLIKTSRLKTYAFLCAFGLIFFAATTPAGSNGTITLSGQASGVVGLYGSPTSSVTTAPGQTGASITLDGDVPANPAGDFTGAVDFGNLSAGDGTPSVASFSFRERGNVQCHVSTSVSAYTATNLSYNGGSGSTPLSGATGTELTFVKLGNGAVTAGANGASGNHSYGPKFTSGTDTLATLNSGAIGSVSTSSDEFATFSAPPSNSGNLTSVDNYVQDTVTFSVPTGFVWAPTNNSGTGTFSVSVQFEIYTGP
jgi:hypothetical protein